MSADQSFGDWLRRRRRALDLTQDELARQVGCSAITLRKLEAEDRRPSKQIAERLAEVCLVPPDERAAFLRFARGDPFAAPAGSPAAAQPAQQREQSEIPRHNLPLQLTSFVGREQEIAQATRLISQGDGHRLLTLTGVGGAGKTRLALEVAAGLLNAFPEGVWLVELASLANPALVPQTVATVLGLREAPGQPFTELLLDHLRPKRLLLVLDNCEHLIQACAELADTLLRACPQLTVLATSREALGIAGEAAYTVPSLSLPEDSQGDALDTINQSEAARLFIERAATALPGFALIHDNAPAVAEICRQLDGIPLAIELAAARVKVLRVEQIVARLGDRFRLLTGGSRTALPRHQTLQALLDWSYDLLSPPEQVLLRRLAVFAGGWTLEAVEAVGSDTVVPGSGMAKDEGSSVLELLTGLANKSLVVVEVSPGPEARYHFLETIRQYALARLAASGEGDEVRQRHATYYVAHAQADRPAYSAPFSENTWYTTEIPNLRAALDWSRTAGGNVELELRLVQMLDDDAYDTLREYLSSIKTALAHAAEVGTDNRLATAQLLAELGWGLTLESNYAMAGPPLVEALRLFRELGDLKGVAETLAKLGLLVREQDDTHAARRYLEESLALFRELGDRPGLAGDLLTLAEVAVMEEDLQGAIALIDEATPLLHSLGDKHGLAWALNHLGHVAHLQSDYTRAGMLQQESQSLFRGLDPMYIGVAETACSLGLIALARGDPALAATHLRHALRVSGHHKVLGRQAWCLAGLAGAAALNEEPERAARLWGAAEAMRQSNGARHAPASRTTRERLMAAAREQLGEAAFAQAWAQGQAMTLEQAVELAIGPSPVTAGRRAS